jgi:hypothetical protein
MKGWWTHCASKWHWLVLLIMSDVFLPSSGQWNARLFSELQWCQLCIIDVGGSNGQRLQRQYSKPILNKTDDQNPCCRGRTRPFSNENPMDYRRKRSSRDGLDGAVSSSNGLSRQSTATVGGVTVIRIENLLAWHRVCLPYIYTVHNSILPLISTRFWCCLA